MGYLRKSNSKDLRHVMANMRVIDKIEAYYQCGCEPEDALALTYCLLYTSDAADE